MQTLTSLAFVEPNLDGLSNETCATVALVGAILALAIILLSPRIK
jgi:hypothetical protein